MIKAFYITIIMSFIAIAVNSQSNLKKGYVITNDKDTVYGLVDFRTDRLNNRECRFKQHDSSTHVVYYPGDIFGYRFINEGKFYVSHDIEIQEEKRKVFLEYMVQGLMNLYYYNDGDQVYYLFEGEDGKINLVTKEADRVRDDRKIVPDKKYIGILKYTFKDVPSIADNIDKMKFNQKSMIKVAKRYHDDVCTTGEKCIIFENENPDKDGVNLKFSAFSGVQFITYKYTYRYSLYSSGKIGVSSIAPMIGGTIALENPRWTKLFSLECSLALSIVDKKETKTLSYAGANREEVLDYKMNILSGKLGPKFKFPLKNKIYPNLGLGFVYTTLINPSAKDGNYQMKKNFVGFYGSIGASYNIRKNQFLSLNYTYDQYLGAEDMMQINGRDKLKLSSLSLGYTF